MKTKYFFTLFIFCIVTNTFSQTSLNDYKYIIVPNSYDFLTTKDQYQLSSLTKFLFNKYGFTAIMEDEVFLQNLISNGCLALRANVEKMKGVFKTKLQVILKNCKNKIIFTSEVGEAREVDYKKAYHIALRDAFKSLEAINYSYKPNENIVALTNPLNTTTNQEIEKLKKEIKTLKTNQDKIVTKTEDEKVVEKLDTEINKIKEETNDSVEVVKIRDAKDELDVINKKEEKRKEETDTKKLKIRGTDKFQAYVNDGEFYYFKPGLKSKYFTDQFGNNKFMLEDTSIKNVFILTIKGIKGVAYFNNEEKSYTLEYDDESGKRQIKIFRLAQ